MDGSIILDRCISVWVGVYLHCVCRVLSNSGPTYLEGMKRTLLFTDSIDAMQDMQMYVDGQPKLKERMKRPKFEAFQSQVGALCRHD